MATWQAAMVGSRPGPGAVRPVGCHLGASQLNSAVRGVEYGCVHVVQCVRRRWEPCERRCGTSAKVSSHYCTHCDLFMKSRCQVKVNCYLHSRRNENKFLNTSFKCTVFCFNYLNTIEMYVFSIQCSATSERALPLKGSQVSPVCPSVKSNM